MRAGANKLIIVNCWSYNSLTQRYNKENDSNNSCSYFQTNATTALFKFTPMRHSDGLSLASISASLLKFSISFSLN